MTERKGKPASVWLADVNLDQNLKSIAQLDDIQWADIGRKLFLSAIVNPNAQTAVYNAETERFVLGVPSETYTWESSFTTTSAAALTLTCPTGYRLEVCHAACENASQASTATLSGSITGNAIPDLITGASGTDIALNRLIGAVTGANPAYPSIDVIGLEAGDSLTLTLNTYAAGNNTEHYFVYKRYRVV